jgi:hypothetical protein
MTTVDPSTSLTTQIDGNTLSLAGDVSGTTPESVLANSPIMTQELAELQANAKAATSSGETTNVVKKVVEALVTVVQALVSVVSLLVGGATSSKSSTTKSTASDVNETSEVVPPASVANAKSNIVVPGATNSAQSTTPAVDTPNVTVPTDTVQAKPSTQVAPSAFEVVRSDVGEVVVRTLDGYVVRAEGRDEAWSITGPDGKMTRIWGDPHVKESDGNAWNFLNRSTFRFGNNKATIEVVPHASHATVTSRLTVYSGDERVTIDGIDKNKPAIVAVSQDGREHDDGLADGISYQRGINANGETWRSNQTGRVM